MRLREIIPEFPHRVSEGHADRAGMASRPRGSVRLASSAEFAQRRTTGGIYGANGRIRVVEKPKYETAFITGQCSE